VLAALALAPDAAQAASFLAFPSGDWFDGASWYGGAVPTITDPVFVHNGGTATATGGALAGRAIQAQLLNIGAGRVELVDTFVELGGNLEIGVVDVADPPATTAGALVSTTDVVGTALIGGRRMKVGVIEAVADPGWTTDGLFSMDGVVEAFGSIDVGVSKQSGVARGRFFTASVLHLAAEDVGGVGVATVEVGTSRVSAATPSPGPTTGDLFVDELIAEYDVDARETSLRVGYAQGATEAEGTAEMGNLYGFSDLLVGVAESAGSGTQTRADGTLIAGRIDRYPPEGPGTPLPPAPGGPLPTLMAGVSLAGAPGVGPAGIATAVSYADIGEIDAHSVRIGVAESGPATGIVVVDHGGPLSGTIGMTTGEADAVGQLRTGGDLGDVDIGISTGSGVGWGEVDADGHAAGVRTGLASAGGEAQGFAKIFGGIRSATGTLAGAGDVVVGFNDRGAGTGYGQLEVDHLPPPPGLTASPTPPAIQARSIAVGVQEGLAPGATADGRAYGDLYTRGDVQSLSAVGDRVGYGNAYSTGRAEGSWTMYDGTYTGHSLTLGLSGGTGIALGVVGLVRMQVDLDELILGEGASLGLSVDSLLSYSAIDAAAAVLDGALGVGFTGTAEPGIYDLIVSGSLDGITGDFASVAIGGLAPGQRASYGVTTADVGGSPVAVYRLQIVPEPGTAGLLALGLAALAARARRAA